MNTVTFDRTDRLVYIETFLEGKNAYRLDHTGKNNPYKQGTVSYLGWEEGFEDARDFWRL